MAKGKLPGHENPHLDEDTGSILVCPVSTWKQTVGISASIQPRWRSEPGEGDLSEVLRHALSGPRAICALAPQQLP